MSLCQTCIEVVDVAYQTDEDALQNLMKSLKTSDEREIKMKSSNRITRCKTTARESYFSNQSLKKNEQIIQFHTGSE